MSLSATELRITPAQAAHVLGRWAGAPVSCGAVEPLTGGMMNSVVKLRFAGPPGVAVLKANSAPDSDFAAEARRLEAARELGGLPCPRVYAHGEPDEVCPWRYLLMEALPGICLAAARPRPESRRSIERDLAGVLAELHTHTRATFGPIDEPGVADWREIMLPRLADMREEMNGRLDDAVLDDIDAVLAQAPGVFAEQGPPTLVHGDVWAGNIMINGGHLSGLVDPGLQYADVELELAYLEVFHTVGRDFFEVYADRHAARPGYPLRRLYYWLNTMMIHVWLFGDRSYVDRTALIAGELRRHFQGA